MNGQGSGLPVELHHSSVTAVARDATPGVFIAGDERGGILRWGAGVTMAPVRWEGHPSRVRAVAAIAGLAVSCCAECLHLWRVATGERLRTVDMTRTFPASVALDPDATLAVVGEGIGEIALVRLADGDVKVIP